jgi:hypothetical protein
VFAGAREFSCLVFVVLWPKFSCDRELLARVRIRTALEGLGHTRG